MNPRALFIIVAAVAGLAVGVGVGWSGWRGDRPAQASRGADGNSARDLSMRGASDPNETALGAALSELLQAKSSLRGMAELAGALDRLERAQSAWPVSSDDRIAWIFKWWQKRDPSAASAWAQPRIAALAQEGPLGFTLELVPRRSPAALHPGGELPVLLLFRGKPIANVLVVAMSRDDPEKAVSARTDAKGLVTLRIAHTGFWLVKAVHMEAAPPDAEVDWESWWASLTFDLPGAPDP